MPLTQEELAGLAGTSRPTVNQVLRQEQERGTVELKRGCTIVLDPRSPRETRALIGAVRPPRRCADGAAEGRFEHGRAACRHGDARLQRHRGARRSSCTSLAPRPTARRWPSTAGSCGRPTAATGATRWTTKVTPSSTHSPLHRMPFLPSPRRWQGLEAGPIRIRVGLHTGTPALDPPKYVGMDVHFAARVMSAAHGGQVVVSQAAAELVEVDLASTSAPIGIKDIAEPVSSTSSAIAPSHHSRRSPTPTCPRLPPRSWAEKGGAVRGRSALAGDAPADRHGARRPGQDALRAGAGHSSTRGALLRLPRRRLHLLLQLPRVIPHLVLATIAQTLPSASSREKARLNLSSHLARQAMLLLLDNLEHLLDCASELSELSFAAPA